MKILACPTRRFLILIIKETNPLIICTKWTTQREEEITNHPQFNTQKPDQNQTFPLKSFNQT